MRTPLAAFLAIVLAGGAVEPAPREAIDSPTASLVGLSSLGAPLKADQAADLASARDPLNGRESPRHRPAFLRGSVLSDGAETAAGAPTRLTAGKLSYVSARYGPEYLALPEPRGTVATVCGPADCVTRRSTDYGPDQRVHPDRIADLSAADFVRVCGVPLSAGLCDGTVELEPPVSPDDDRMRQEDAGPTLPPTDSEEDPA
jgi:hypothetical protein